MRRGWFALVALAAAAVVLGASMGSAVAAKKPRKVPRPSYTVRQAPVVESPYVVMHYVRRSKDAPRLVDDDKDGIPNYVEKAAAAFNEAWLFYGKNGFKAPLSDAAGPNPKVDVYVKNLPRGVFGVAVSPKFGAGGAFMVIGNSLNMAHRTVGSLQQTVAHELFHLFQYSYVPDGDIPAWVAEGSATAMETYVYPQIVDAATFSLIDRWLDQPWRSLYDEARGCEHCYGGALWWRFVFSMGNNIFPEYFGRLYGYKKIGKPILNGLQPLNEIIKKRTKGKSDLYEAFTRFSYNIYRAGYRPAPAYRLYPSTSLRTTKIRIVRGLSTHYVPLHVPAGTRGLAVGVASGGGPTPSGKLVVGGPKGRVVGGARRNGGRGRYFAVPFRNAKERKNVMLIITSGREEGAAYLVAHQAVS